MYGIKIPKPNNNTIQTQTQTHTHTHTHTHNYSMGFSGGSDGKESACNARDLDLIPVLGRFPAEGNLLSTPIFCLENPYGQRSLAGYSL